MHCEDFFNYMITYCFSYKIFSSFSSQNIYDSHLMTSCSIFCFYDIALCVAPHLLYYRIFMPCSGDIVVYYY